MNLCLLSGCDRGALSAHAHGFLIDINDRLAMRDNADVGCTVANYPTLRGCNCTVTTGGDEMHMVLIDCIKGVPEVPVEAGPELVGLTCHGCRDENRGCVVIRSSSD